MGVREKNTLSKKQFSPLVVEFVVFLVENFLSYCGWTFWNELAADVHRPQLNKATPFHGAGLAEQKMQPAFDGMSLIELLPNKQ